MNTDTIFLGYEVGTGEEVRLPLHHMVVTGLTRLSGKTTTCEAIMGRLPDGYRALAFRTKRGEVAFTGASLVQPYFRARTDWQYVESLLEAAMKERLKFERSWLIKATRGTTTLQQVYANILAQRDSKKPQRGIDESVWTNLAAYFEIVLPQLEVHPFVTTLDLVTGANVMDLGHLSEEVQALVIASCLELIWKTGANTLVVIPEAWRFVPQQRGNPVKWAAQHVIREGGSVGVFLILDSQDIAGVDKAILKSCDTWLLGRQRERNEVEHVLDQLPTRDRPKVDQIMTLPLGHFYAASGDWCKKVYVCPLWLESEEARAIALGIRGPVGHPSEGSVNLEEDEAMWKERALDLENQLLEVRRQMETLVAEKGRVLRAMEMAQEAQGNAETALGILQGECLRFKEETLASMRRIEALSDLTMRFRTDLREFLGVEGGETQATPLEEERIVQRVLQQVNRNGGSRPVQLAPLEALREGFQREALERVRGVLAGLTERERHIIAWLEQQGEVVTSTALALHVEGRDFGKGGGYAKAFGTMLRVLGELSLIRSSGAQGKYGPGLRAKVASILSPYPHSTDQEEEVYQHLLVGLTEELMQPVVA